LLGFHYPAALLPRDVRSENSYNGIRNTSEEKYDAGL